MGQYHLIANLDKREYIHAHRVGSGLKAWEQAANSRTSPALMFYLMVCPEPRGGGDFEANDMMGRWHGDRVVVIGDYAETTDFDSPIDADLIYNLCSDDELSTREWIAEVRAPDYADRYGHVAYADRLEAELDKGGAFLDISEPALKAYAEGMGFLEVQVNEWGQTRLIDGEES